MPKIQYNNQQYTVTIPKEFIEQAGIKKGDVATVSFNERGNIELRFKK
jgi:bifunctional DNA-binding transcriptional regulator/antitoxin component of YhaV-PrlF toxin-antitoxin module